MDVIFWVRHWDLNQSTLVAYSICISHIIHGRVNIRLFRHEASFPDALKGRHSAEWSTLVMNDTYDKIPRTTPKNNRVAPRVELRPRLVWGGPEGESSHPTAMHQWWIHILLLHHLLPFAYPSVDVGTEGEEGLTPKATTLKVAPPRVAALLSYHF
jgi:hypothetical protein